MNRHLDDWIDAYLQFTNNSEPPELFRLWTAISVIAAALQRKCRLEWGTITFYPNMYVVLVAPTGKARKGTAMTPGLDLLQRLGIKLAAEATTRESLVRELKNSNDTAINLETGEMEFHSSLTIYSQELTVFLGYNNRQLMSDLTDWYDCRKEWVYRTKTQGEDHIIGVFVNIFGATTPELIQTTMPMDAIGGGLTSRIIFVFEERRGKVVPTPFLNEEELKLWENLYYDLERIHLMSGKFRVSSKFLDKWVEWYIVQEDNPPFSDERLSGYIERRPTHLMKLGIIVSASRSDKMVITGEDFDKARSILEATERKMPRAFRGVGRSAVAELIPRIMAFIANKKEVELSELMRQFQRDIDRYTLEDRVIKTLKLSGYITDVLRDSKTYIIYKGAEDED